MESLKGIFPQMSVSHKRDFLKENVDKIKHIQARRLRRPSNQTEYSKFNSKSKKKIHGSINSLSLQPSKMPMNNLRKSMSQLSIHSRDCGVQTMNPDDEYFLKDSIIRYPSASTVRSTLRPASSTHQLTCSKGHQLERPQTPQRPRRQLSEKMDRHLSNLSEYLDQGSITSAKKSILKNSSKTSKDLINESQQKLDRGDIIDLSRDNDDDDDEEVKKDKIMEKSVKAEEKKRQEALKLAEADPDCPTGHVPLTEDERLEALKLAKNRKREELIFPGSNFLILIFFISGFKDLIDDLNRLPMTCETLRVRNRKIAIEKELRTIEINIRVFSKPKVYVKLN